MFKAYYRLIKPGIIYGNLLTAGAGFLLADKWHIRLWLLVSTLGGIALVIGSACVVNNYTDQGIDKKMNRTRDRALASGQIPGRNALIYAAILGLVGLALLSQTNILTITIGLIAYIDYTLFYAIAKRRSVQGTLVGSIAGAMPPVAGYTAVSGHFNGAAVMLFLMLVTWQMPHFYSIAIYRIKDYRAAKLPVLPIKKGIEQTKIQIMLYISAFTACSALLTVLGYTGIIYLAIVLILGLSWLWRGFKSFKNDNDQLWARKMFMHSLMVISALSMAIAVGNLLP